MHLAPEVIALLALAATLAGFIDAIAGGGGLITLPALLAAGVPPVMAIGTNKIQGSVGTASATWSFWRAGKIDFHHIKIPLAFTLVGAVLGSLLLLVADTRWLMVLLPILLIAIALYFLLGPKASDEDSHARLTPLAYAFVAGGIGLYDGFFGPGTGSFLRAEPRHPDGHGPDPRHRPHQGAQPDEQRRLGGGSWPPAVTCCGSSASAWPSAQFIGGRLGSRAALRFGPKLIRPLLVVICLAMVAKLLSDPANPLRHLVEAWLA